MWIWEAPSSTARRASAAYSSGVYGIAGHWSRLAIAPLMEQEMMTGSSKRLMNQSPVASRQSPEGETDGDVAQWLVGDVRRLAVYRKAVDLADDVRAAALEWNSF